MDGDLAFLDASFVVAEFDRGDENHGRASALRRRCGRVSFVTTELVLIEVADALSRWNREVASDFVNGCVRGLGIRVVSIE